MSSSNCPPQLHLTLPTNATSFKRSFEQFGFDLESPVASAEAGSSDSSNHPSSAPTSASERSERNKRARSTSTSSGSGRSPESTRTSHSSPSPPRIADFRTDSEHSAPSPIPPLPSSTIPSRLHTLNSFLEPPRLPTPDLPDIEMTDYPLEEVSQPVSPVPSSGRDDLFRLSFDRFTAFDSQVSVLRDSRSHSVRSPSPPPTLPPLTLSSTLDDGPSLNPVSPSLPSSRSEPSPVRESLFSLYSSHPQPSPRDGTFDLHLDSHRNFSHNMRNPEGSGSGNDRDRTTSSSSLSAFTFPQATRADTTDGIPPHFWSLGGSPPAPGPEHSRRDTTPFRHRLDAALRLLRSHSPLLSDSEDQPSTRPDPFPPPLSRTHSHTDDHDPWSIPSSSLSSFSSDSFLPAPERSSFSRTIPPVFRESSTSSSERRSDIFPTFPDRNRRWERESDSNDENNHDTSVRTGPRDFLPRMRNLHQDLDIARQLELLAELRSLESQTEHFSTRLNSLARNSTSRPPNRSGFSPEIATFIDRELNDRAETRPLTRRGTLPRLPTESRQVHPQNPPQNMGDDATSSSDSSDSEWIRRRSRLLRLDLPGRASANHDILSAANVESTSHESRPLAHRQSQNFSSSGSYPPFTISRLSTPSPIFDMTPDTDEPGPSRSGISLPPPPGFPLRPHIQSTLPNSRTIPTNPVASEFDQRMARLRMLSQLSDDPFDVMLTPNDYEERADRARWPSDIDPRNEGSQPPVRATRVNPFNASNSSSASLSSGPRRNGDNSHGSTNSLFSRRSFSLDLATGGGGDEGRHNGGPVSISRNPPSMARRFLAVDETPNTWEDSRVDIGVPLSAQGTPWFSSILPSRPDMDLTHTQARGPAYHNRRRSIPPPPPPPRAPFSLPIPEFSPIFDPLSDRGELNPFSQPDLNPSSISRSRSRFSLGDFNLSQSTTSSPTSEERDRGPPTMSSSSHLPSENQASIYRNADPNTHHDGPDPSLLRPFEHRFGWRPNRSETAIDVSSNSSLPPSLPPLHFEYPPLNGVLPPGGESSSVTQEVPSSNPNTGFGTGRMEARRPRVGSDAIDEILRERLRRRAPPSIPTSRDGWRNGTTPLYGGGVGGQQHRPHLSDGDHMQARRGGGDTHGTSPSQARGNELGRMESADPGLRGRLSGFAHAIDILRGDGLSGSSERQFVEHFEREASGQGRGQEGGGAGLRRRTTTTTTTNWGEIEGVSEGRILFPNSEMFGRRRGMVRRSQDTPSDRFVPVSEPPSRLNAGRGGNTARHRRPSQSPSRDEHGGEHERVTMRSRFRSRGVRARLHPDRELIEDLANFEFSFGRRSRAMGDYMRDEDFDSSYESLLSLAAALGDVKPPSVPEIVIASLPTGLYKDWALAESDKRCPICLDDYTPLDPVAKLWGCSHWLHKKCLEQWLRGASTCPVCRRRVEEDFGGLNRHHQHHQQQQQQRQQQQQQHRGLGEDPGPSGIRRSDGR